MTTYQAFVRRLPAPVIAAVIAGDRATKLAIEHRMGGTDVIPVIPGWLRIVHVENTGAAFGMLAEAGPLVRTVVLIGISAVVTVLVIAALISDRKSYSALATRLSLALILGGAAGNLYDRLVRGAVTDFIEVYHGAWSFPSFNVADSAITIGAVLLIGEALFLSRHARESQPQLAQK